MFGAVLTGAPPELLPIVLPAFKWLFGVEDTGMPGIGNRCIDAAFTLQAAYNELGIEAHIVPVQLVVHDQQSGRQYVHGAAEPRWSTDAWNGHCILYFPNAGRRFVDVTAEQYSEIARLKMGPVVGRTSAVQGEFGPGAALPEGAVVGVQRQHLLLAYTVASSDSHDHLHTRSEVMGHKDGYQRAGANLAAHTIASLLHPEIEPARRAAIPYPRITALLKALDGAPFHPDGDDWVFAATDSNGVTRMLRLDQVPVDVPTSTSAEAQR